MKIGIRVFLGFFIVVGLTAWLGLQWIQKELRPIVSQASEESLVETAHLLVSIVQPYFIKHKTIHATLATQLNNYIHNPVNAYIWQRHKTNLNLRIYITNQKGIVVFDSLNQVVGKDYSTWNDVYLTLQGKYGARSTRLNTEDEFSSVMYVSAPIKDNDQIVGSLTVSLPNNSTQPYIEYAKQRLYLYGGVLISVAFLIGSIITAWLVINLRKISNAATQIGNGTSMNMPRFAQGTELEQLVRSLETMRNELQGKKYVENYVHTLTHELKSPLAAIRASNELLQDTEMPLVERQQFIYTIEQQCLRLQQLIDRLLNLAKLEQLHAIQLKDSINLFKVCHALLQNYQAQAQAKSIQLEIDGDTTLVVWGEHFLLEQAITNLLDNALAFATSGSRIHISITASPAAANPILCIHNVGPHIPEFALPRLKERFYGLPRPDQTKGAGLGLNFVYEIMSLHHGSFEIANTDHGVKACLLFP